MSNTKILQTFSYNMCARHISPLHPKGSARNTGLFKLNCELLTQLYAIEG